MDFDLDENKRYCFCFDRDETVTTGQPPGPVDIDVLEELKEYGSVWATGNQKLKQEADIEGRDELLEYIGLPDAILNKNCGRYGMIQMAFEVTDANVYIVVDDEDVSDIDYVDYYAPEEFIQQIIE